MGTEKVSRKPRAAVVVAGTEAGNEGGGAHGAVGWGVMDQFLEDGRLSIEGVSGTSAGAMNAVVCAHGKIREIASRCGRSLNRRSILRNSNAGQKPNSSSVRPMSAPARPACFIPVKLRPRSS